MMKGIEKIKDKIKKINEMPNAKTESSEKLLHALLMRFLDFSEISHLNFRLVGGRLSPQSFFELFLQHRKDSKKIADNTIGGYFKDGSLRVFIDGDDDVRCLHPGLMLNSA
jgi:hypothetical protein